MSIRKLALAAILSASLSSAPVMAQVANRTATVERASVERASVDQAQVNAQAGQFPFLIVLLIIATGLGIFAATQDGTPASP